MTRFEITKQRVPWHIYLFGALAELLFGYDTGIVGVAMLSIQTEFDLSPAAKGFVVSSLLLGAAVGVAVAGRLADRWGRKPMLLITAIIFAIGGLVAAFAPSVAMLVIGRFVMGLGVGASSSVVSVYLVEVAPTRHRGKIGSLGQLMVVVGILVAYIVGYALQPIDAWRLMMGLSIIPAVAISLGFLLTPETPRWLVSRGRFTEAVTSLKRLGRASTAEAEVNELRTALAAEAGRARSTLAVIREMFARDIRRNAWAAIGVAMLPQFMGVNSILYFAPTSLVSAGFGDAAALTANISVGVTNVVFTIIGISIVDRVTRRRLLTIGTIGMVVSMAALAVWGALNPHASVGGAWFTLAFMIVFLAAFSSSWGVCVRVVISELFPSSIRGSAVGLILILNWLANFAVSQVFPSLAAISTSLSYAIFAVFGVGAFIFVRLGFPETGRRSLEDIQKRVTEQTDTLTI